MKKINGTLYSPITGSNTTRQEMHVETVPKAVVFEDGSTLQGRIDNKGNPIVVSNYKPTSPSLWIKPDGIDPSTYFDFSDINITPDIDTTHVHTLKSPVDDDGVRYNVYPITDSDSVRVNGLNTLTDVFNRYDMGFVVGREKPENKAVWGNTIYETITITDFGQEEEVIVMNDYLASSAVIDNTTYNANNKVFNIDGEKLVLFDPESELVSTATTIPNKSCYWITKSYDTYSNLNMFLLDAINIDGTDYASDYRVFAYNGKNYAFFNPDLLIISDEEPIVFTDTIWADTSNA